jgi:hypothetical protein
MQSRIKRRVSSLVNAQLDYRYRKRQDHDLESYLWTPVLLPRVLQVLGFPLPVTADGNIQIINHSSCRMVERDASRHRPLLDLEGLNSYPVGHVTGSIICVAQILSNGLVRLADSSGSHLASVEKHSNPEWIGQIVIMIIEKSRLCEITTYPQPIPPLRYLNIRGNDYHILIPPESILKPPSPNDSQLLYIDYKRPISTIYHSDGTETVQALMNWIVVSGVRQQKLLIVRFTSPFLPLYHCLKVNEWYRFHAPEGSVSHITSTESVLDWSEECHLLLLIPSSNERACEIESCQPIYESILELKDRSHVLRFGMDLVTIQGIVHSTRMIRHQRPLLQKAEDLTWLSHLGYDHFDMLVVLVEQDSLLELVIPFPALELEIQEGRRVLARNLSLQIRNGNLSCMVLASSQIQVDDEPVASSSVGVVAMHSRITHLADMLSVDSNVVMTSGWLSVYPLNILQLELSLSCLTCQRVSEQEECVRCGEICAIQGLCNIMVQDGSCEFIACFGCFEVVQKVLYLQQDQIKRELLHNAGSILKNFKMNDVVEPDSDWITRQCLYGNWKRRMSLRLLQIPARQRGLFHQNANISSANHLGARLFKDLEGSMHPCLALKFLKVLVSDLKDCDPKQETLDLLLLL